MEEAFFVRVEAPYHSVFSFKQQTKLPEYTPCSVDEAGVTNGILTGVTPAVADSLRISSGFEALQLQLRVGYTNVCARHIPTTEGRRVGADIFSERRQRH